MPRTARRLAALLLAAATLASLAACAPGETASTPSPSPVETDAPIFASDEEALAAAVASLLAYADTSARITGPEQADPEKIRSTVSPKLAESFVPEFEALRTANLVLIGLTRVENAQLIERKEVSGSAEISVYFCRDVSETRVVDATGADVTPATRPDRVPMKSSLISADLNSETLLVEDIEEWSGAGVC